MGLALRVWGWHCDVSLLRVSVESLLLYFPSSTLLTCLGRLKGMASGARLCLPTWEICMEFLASAWPQSLLLHIFRAISLHQSALETNKPTNTSSWRAYQHVDWPNPKILGAYPEMYMFNRHSLSLELYTPFLEAELKSSFYKGLIKDVSWFLLHPLNPFTFTWSSQKKDTPFLFSFFSLFFFQNSLKCCYWASVAPWLMYKLTRKLQFSRQIQLFLQ